MTSASRLLLALALLLTNIPAFAQIQSSFQGSSSRSASSFAGVNDVPEPGTIPLVVLAIAGAIAVSRYIKRGKGKNDKRGDE